MGVAPERDKESAAISDNKVHEARALLEKGQVSQACNCAEEAVQLNKNNTEALYLTAVCNRYLQKTTNAKSALSRLKRLLPTYGRAFQEEGHLFRLENDIANAISSYQRAVMLNSALVASWKALSELYEAVGDEDGMQRVKDQLTRLQAAPPELVSIESMIHEGKLLKAEQLCRDFLQKNPHHVEAMRLLADLGSRLHVLDDAEFLLESCLEFEPDHIQARLDYVNVLHQRQKFEKALEQAAILRERERGNPIFESAFANQSMAIGDFDTALEIYDALLEQYPNTPITHLVRGHALKTVGRQDAAIESYRTAYKVKPDFGDAFWSLANLKTYRFTDDEIKQMQACERDPGTQLEDHFHLCFALGKAFEDLAEFDSSFTYYERGNALKKAQLQYDPDKMQKEFETQKAVLSKEFFEQTSHSGASSPAPIFIVGLPRAGSTLLEQILASHSMVDGTLELPNIPALVHRLNGRQRISDDPRYPDVLNELDHEQLTKFGESYIESTEVYRSGAARFTDKMPNNFRHIGLIHLILPNAKIIDARRDPMACCFSGFKQLFAQGQEFTYGLEDIGRYYQGYVELMHHWDEVLPGKVLRVQYEDVITDLETQIRKILEFCELPFEDACIEYYKTERSVRTASSEQVRQPIYDEGVEHWRNYEGFLAPLKSALGPTLVST